MCNTIIRGQNLKNKNSKEKHKVKFKLVWCTEPKQRTLRKENRERNGKKGFLVHSDRPNWGSECFAAACLGE